MTENIKEIITTPVDEGKHNNIHYFVMIIYNEGKPVKLRMTELMDDGIVLLLRNTNKEIPYPEEVISGLALAFPDSKVGVNLDMLKQRTKVNTHVALKNYNNNFN